MGSTSGYEITHPITVILDGLTSYHAWSQNMIVFLKGRRLWRYVTGDIPKPVPGLVTDSNSSDGDSVTNAVVQVVDFEARLEKWESIQCRILSWFINTSVPAISSLLPRLETGQAAWSFLATRLLLCGNKLAATDPPLRYAEDIDLFVKCKDRRHFTQFMMGLREDFEPTQATLLSCSPLPSLDAAVKELISEENRHLHHHLSSSDIVLATLRPPSSSSDQPHRICTYCQKPAAVSSAPVDDPVVTVSQLESMFHRYMSQPSPALSVTSGNKSWLLDSACCNHMTPYASHFSQKTPLAPSPIIYTADSSHMSVSHIGTISSPELTIPDTYLVPKLSLNLLFAVRLDIYLSCCNLQIPSHMVSSSVAATTTLSPNLWHSRLGHASLSRLQLLASQGNLPLSYFMTNSQTIPLFEYSVVFVLSLFLPMNETNSNHGLGCVVFLVMISLKRVFAAMIPYLVAFASPVMDFAPPPSSSDVPSLVLSPVADSPNSDPAPSAPSESPTDIRRSTQMDVKNAFLNGDLLEEVYMQPPSGYPDSQNQGFIPSSYDLALFIRHTSTGITLILLYVDDMIITGDDTAGIRDLQKFLSQHFEMKDFGTLSYFLGFKVTSSSDGYYLSQAKYAFDLLSKAGLTDSKTVFTPLELNVKFNPIDGEPFSDATLYRQLVGSLIYLTVTCPDLAYVVHLVSQFMFAPHSTHYAAVLRILRYIKGTLFHRLHFSAQSSLELHAYADADWAEDPTNRRSTTGYCFLLGSSLISWHSKKQSVVARSSTEAEYRALADATSELLWLRWLLTDMGAPQTTSTPIHCDNCSAIHIAHNDVFHERTKHIEIDCHFIRHHLQAECSSLTICLL
uniref:Reverse transcriptase Ty1/copia-type domain-containing protein n=1 Tax=Fagus sylvatica TaxID=28930 RepID=A0A2N9HUY6_FAGSY